MEINEFLYDQLNANEREKYCKLPKWAQYRMEILATKINDSKERVKELVADNQDGPISVSSGCFTEDKIERKFNNNHKVSFHLGDEIIEAKIRDNAVVITLSSLFSNGNLIIRPAYGNQIEISVK